MANTIHVCQLSGLSSSPNAFNVKLCVLEGIEQIDMPVMIVNFSPLSDQCSILSLHATISSLYWPFPESLFLCAAVTYMTVSCNSCVHTALPVLNVNTDTCSLVQILNV